MIGMTLQMNQCLMKAKGNMKCIRPVAHKIFLNMDQMMVKIIHASKCISKAGIQAYMNMLFSKSLKLYFVNTCLMF